MKRLNTGRMGPRLAVRLVFMDRLWHRLTRRPGDRLWYRLTRRFGDRLWFRLRLWTPVRSRLMARLEHR